MLDRSTAQEISGLCVGQIDWATVGSEGGTVAIFTGGDRYHASYGAEGDPVKETSRAGESGGGCRFESDGTASPDHPVICTVSVHDGIAETDVRHMPPMPGGDAYEYVANMELDRRFAHDWSGEYYWPDWPNGTAEAWRQFREEIEDVEPDDYVPSRSDPRRVEAHVRPVRNHRNTLSGRDPARHQDTAWGCFRPFHTGRGWRA